MQPHERLQIYNQQYWWRLFSALRDVIPSTAAYLGQTLYQKKIAEPYLLAYTSTSWSLYEIGNHLISWLEKNFKGDSLVLSLAKLDRAFYETFLQKVIDSPLDPSRIFYLQPHVKLIVLEEDLLTFRKALLEKQPLPKRDKKRLNVALYRVPCTGKTFWHDFTDEQFALLKAFEKGATLEEALGSSFEGDLSATFSLFASIRLLCHEAS